MRIQSNFKDFYDSVQMYGSDADLIYRRFTSEVEWSTPSEVVEFYNSIPRGRLHHTFYTTIEPVVVGFAGKLYALFEVNPSSGRGFAKWNPNFIGSTSKQIAKYLDVVKRFPSLHYGGYEKKNGKTILEIFQTPLKKEKSEDFMYRRGTLNPRADVIDDFVELRSGRKVSDTIFQNLKAPVFIWVPNTDHKIILNPKLEDFGFSSILDPYAAFQELSMYLGGVMTTEKEIVKITDDKILAAKKGFDKHSFRQVSPGKKFKRRQK